MGRLVGGHRHKCTLETVVDWKAVREDWTIGTDGKKTTESYDYAQAPSEDFAYLMLYHPSFC